MIENDSKAFWNRYPNIGKVLGAIFIFIGFLSLITPFTPLGFFFLLGLEFLGVRQKYWEKVKTWVDEVARKL